ncbi:MAG: hypothetical protein ABI680_20470 [Chthoniobacteraceae bacterium]
MAGSTSFREEICRACGAKMSIPAGTRKRKVQCPRCREIVSLGAEEPPPQPDALTRADLELRLQQLEARVAALERTQTVASPVEEPVAKPAVAPISGHLKWAPPNTNGAGDEAARGAHFVDTGAAADEILRHNLRILGGRRITIQAPPDDPTARRTAHHFDAIFRRANWDVKTAIEEPSHPESGLFLAAGACPGPREMTSAFMALTAAGVQFEALLDPGLRFDEVVLTIGPNTEIKGPDTIAWPMSA